MRAGDNGHTWMISHKIFEKVNNVVLPVRVKMNIQFINQNNSILSHMGPNAKKQLNKAFLSAAQLIEPMFFPTTIDNRFWWISSNVFYELNTFIEYFFIDYVSSFFKTAIIHPF